MLCQHAVKAVCCHDDAFLKLATSARLLLYMPVCCQLLTSYAMACNCETWCTQLLHAFCPAANLFKLLSKKGCELVGIRSYLGASAVMSCWGVPGKPPKPPAPPPASLMLRTAADDSSISKCYLVSSCPERTEVHGLPKTDIPTP